jgi:hypothetical protein
MVESLQAEELEMNRRHLIVIWILVTVLATAAFLTARLTRSSPAALAAGGPASDQIGQTSFYQLYLPLIVDDDIPVILYFEADVPIADPGDTITLSWDTLNVATATIYRMLPGGPIVEFWDVAPSGTMNYTIGLHQRISVPFMLGVASQSGQHDHAFFTVLLTCPDDWFFSPAPDDCPGGPPLYSDGAEQPFEAGYMLWIDEQSRIYVLFDDDVSSPRWAIYPDTWEDGDELCDVVEPPPGYSQPERGFGKVWCEEPTVRDRLGWATADEIGYETAVQSTYGPQYVATYIRAADGNVWKLLPERSGWEKIIVD